MSDKPGSVLIAEVGSTTTRVTLIDTVDGESRLLGQAEVPSTVEPPYADALIGVLEATAYIAEATGRQLLRDGRLLQPQNNERDGINHLVLTTSAAGNLELIIVAIAHDISARSALHATRNIYSNVLQTVTLDDAALDPVLQRTTSWVERQVQTMLSRRPDAILLAGGLESGATDVLCRLARIVGFTIEHMPRETDRQSQRDGPICPVIYAGNSEAQECVREALANRARVLVAENLRPSLEEERLEQTRSELNHLYNERVLPRLPGMGGLKRLCSGTINTVCEAEGIMTRFLSERYERRVLTVDIGSTSSSAFLASPGRFHPAVLGTCGTGFGLMTVVQQRGLDRIARWLPFRIGKDELMHWLINKVLRPHIIPSSREDILIEHAVTREALALLLESLKDECPSVQYDLLVVGGGVLAHAPHPGLAALTVLDALQPAGEESTLALDMHLDGLGLLPACGALATLDLDAAVTMFDRDVLNNQPLATCVVALGSGKPDDVAIEAELAIGRGRSRRVSVRHGQIACLPLGQGMRGRLTLRPAAGVRIGRNAPGAEVSSDVAAIAGSVLGVIIDARGRPLQLARDDTQRRSQLWEWLVALGAEKGYSPYLDSSMAAPPTVSVTTSFVELDMQNGDGKALPVEPPVAVPPFAGTAEVAETPRKGRRISLTDLEALEQPQPPEQPPQRGRRIVLDDLARQPEPTKQAAQPDEPENVLSDLAQLRQSMEVPEKERRGIFGRKKK